MEANEAKMEVWGVVNDDIQTNESMGRKGDGSRKISSDRGRLSVNKIYREIVGSEGVTWVPSKLYNVSYFAQKWQNGSRVGSWVPFTVKRVGKGVSLGV
jgi:hypothetical protein